MSLLSKITGIGINPLKGKIKIDPIKAIGTGLTVASFGGLGPLAGAAGKLGSLASKVPGVAKVGGMINTLGKIPGVSKVAGGVGSIYNTLSGRSGVPNLDPQRLQDMIRTTGSADSRARTGGGGWLDDVLGGVTAIRKATGGKPITLKNTLGGIAKKVGGAIGKNPLEYAGAAAAGVSAAQAYKRAGDYEGKAIKTKEQSYSERAPLRARGVSGMLKETAQAPQDFTNAQNPFARKRKVSL